MATAKTLPTTQSVSSYLDAIEDEARRKDCEALAALMKRITGCAAKMWGTAIVGFDQYHDKYASGHEGDSSVIGFVHAVAATRQRYPATKKGAKAS